MKCTFCGAELNDDVMFCTECGRAVEATPAEPAEAFVKADKDPGKIFGIISLILGILAIVFPILFTPCCCCCSTYGIIFIAIAEVIAFIMAIAGIILGALGSKKSKAAGYKNTLATIGLILSIISAALAVIAIVLAIVGIVLVFVLGVGTAFMESMMYSLY